MFRASEDDAADLVLRKARHRRTELAANLRPCCREDARGGSVEEAHDAWSRTLELALPPQPRAERDRVGPVSLGEHWIAGEFCSLVAGDLHPLGRQQQGELLRRVGPKMRAWTVGGVAVACDLHAPVSKAASVQSVLDKTTALRLPYAVKREPAND